MSSDLTHPASTSAPSAPSEVSSPSVSSPSVSSPSPSPVFLQPPPADPSQHTDVSHFLSDMADKPTFWKNPFFIAALIGVLGMPFLRQLLPRRIPPPPPILAIIPDFSLLDHHGKPFGLERLKGHVTIASFFFTSCPTVCPRITAAMRDLQRRYKQAAIPIPIRFLSISVDPETDTPSKLRSYAAALQLDLAQWTFLTGPKAQIYSLAENGFKTAVGSATSRPSVMEITHSEKLILIDQEGRIRGYYPIGPMGKDEIFHRAQHVFHSMPSPKSR